MIKLIFLSIFIVLEGVIGDNQACGDWDSYKEEKCIKVIDKVGLQTFDDAEKSCEQQDNTSTLLTIHYQEEQDFIANLIFKTHKVVDNVWIGAKYNKKFTWLDNTNLTYTYWNQGSPKNLTDHCIQLNSDENGKWDDVLCEKKNFVVCQKQQTWSIEHLQKLLLDISKNPFPIGFIYTQLPNEQAPSEIWPWMTWKDISNKYSGVFFRVDGGNSNSFGQVQSENSPRLIEVDHVAYSQIADKSRFKDNVTLSAGVTSDWVFTGGLDGTSRYMRFITSDGEIRPRNMAIKIWRRDN